MQYVIFILKIRRLCFEYWLHLKGVMSMAAKKGLENETKRDKFVRLAEARTNKIIDMIQLLGNCSNTSQYEFSQKDVDKIFKAIQVELDEARKRFSKQDSDKGSKFTLN